VNNKYICINCLRWVDRLFCHVSLENGKDKAMLLCQECLLEQTEVFIDSELMHYSVSKDILQAYLKELKGYKEDPNLVDKEYIEKEVLHLEQIILPSIERKIDQLKAHLI